MNDTNTLRQDEPAGRHALAFVTAAAALIAALLTTEARAQSNALVAALDCAGENAETLATIVREFPDYQKHTMEMLLTAHREFQESPVSELLRRRWSAREAVLWMCGGADEIPSLLRALRRGNFEFADSFMAAARAQMKIHMQLRNSR